VFAHIHWTEQNDVLLEVRQWEHELDEEGHPELGLTCNGLLFNKDQWERLMYFKRKVARAIMAIKNDRPVDETYELGDMRLITMTSPFWVVNIRQWWEKKGELLPGRNGVPLRFDEWKRLTQLQDVVLRLRDDIADREMTSQQPPAKKQKKQATKKRAAAPKKDAVVKVTAGRQNKVQREKLDSKKRSARIKQPASCRAQAESITKRKNKKAGGG
jgi:hypothetical protein